MDRIIRWILNDRYRLLAATLLVYMVALGVEGEISDRESRVLDWDNRFFDLSLQRTAEDRDAAAR